MNGAAPSPFSGIGGDARGDFDATDPRARIVAAVVFAGATLALQAPVPLCGAVALAIVAAWAVRMPLRRLLVRLTMLEGFMVVLLATLPFTVPGKAILSIGPLSATLEGVTLAIGIALKANAIVLMLLSQIGTIEPTRLGHALIRLGLPSILVGLMLLTVRYIGVLENEYRRLRRAMRSRAFRPSANPHTWQSLGWLMGMLLVRSNDRAHRLLQAMKCRGYTGRFFLIDRLAMTTSDWLYGVVALTISTCLLLWDRL